MASKLSTQLLEEKDYDQWKHLLSASPQGNIYSSPEYLSTLCEAAGGTFRILTMRRDNEILGGLGLYERKSRAGIYVAPRLLLYYNGLVFRSFDTKYPSKRTSQSLEIMGAIEEALTKLNYARVILKNHPSVTDVRLFQARGWATHVNYTYVVPVLDLSLAWDRMEQNLRRFVTRCIQEGLQFSDDDDFDSFFRMHLQTVERKGTTLYLPEQNFKRYFERLRALGLCRLYQARLPKGRAIATELVLLGPYPHAHTVCAGAEKKFLSMGANAFLRWRVFEALSRLGYAANDLTDAALNPVTHFKSQLGGNLQVCFEVTRPDRLAFRAYLIGCQFLKVGQKVLHKLAS